MSILLTSTFSISIFFCFSSFYLFLTFKFSLTLQCFPFLSFFIFPPNLVSVLLSLSLFFLSICLSLQSLSFLSFFVFLYYPFLFFTVFLFFKSIIFTELSFACNLVHTRPLSLIFFHFFLFYLLYSLRCKWLFTLIYFIIWLEFKLTSQRPRALLIEYLFVLFFLKRMDF